MRRTKLATALVGVLAVAATACVSRPGSGSAGTGCADGVQDPEGPVVTNVAYGYDTVFHLANIYPACTAQAVGTVMYVHGGGYTGGDKSEGAWPAVARLRNLGWVVVSINYRLAPAYGWSAQPNDVRRAIDWWRGQGAAAHGAPAAPLVGVGWSAGGQLVEWVTADDGGAAFDAAVSVGGATSWPDRPPSGAASALFGLNPPQWLLEEASTVTHLDPADPPILHIHAENDSFVPVSQATILQQAIDAQGDPARHTVDIDPTCGHSQDCMTPDRIDPFLAAQASG